MNPHDWIPLTWAIVYIILILLFYENQVRCPHCGWYHYYRFFKPKQCKNCGKKLIE